MEKTRILFVAANPAATGHLRLDAEIREIESRLTLTSHRDAIEIIAKWAVRPRDLLEHLNRYRPHIVHFSGHGSDTEEIILENEDGRPTAVSKSALVGLFTTLRDEIRVVVLNACFSEPQADAITKKIDFAIGMTREIGDRAATVFSSSFYSALGFGRSVQEAFDQGRLALMLENIREDLTPKLIVRDGANASEVHLLLTEREPAAKSARPWGGNPVALVVEDDAAIRSLLISLLRREGFNASGVDTVASAVSSIKNGDPDIVILDMELPDGTGVDVLNGTVGRLRGGVIFLTQRQSSADKIEGLTRGGDDYITKPFDPEELLARVRSVLRRVRSGVSSN